MSISSTKLPMSLKQSTFMQYGQDYIDKMSSALSPAAEALPSQQPRVFGQYQGRIWMSEDF
jgi:hypothetical protein